MAPLSLQGGYTFSNNATAADATLVFNGSISGVAGPLTLTGSNTGSNTINGVIADGSGVVSLSKTGTGTWILAASNTFTGATAVTTGTLQLNNTGALTSSAMTLNGGTLALRADAPAVFATASTTLASNSTVNVDRLSSGSGNQLSLGALGITANSAALTVTGANGYSLGVGAVTQSSASATLAAFTNSVNMTIDSFTTLSNSATALEFRTAAGATATVTGNITQSGTGVLTIKKNTAGGTAILQGTRQHDRRGGNQ